MGHAHAGAVREQLRLIVALGVSTTSRGQQIRSPFRSPLGPLSVTLRDFEGADKEAWLIGLSYDFAPELGVKGLSGLVNYARGNARPDA